MRSVLGFLLGVLFVFPVLGQNFPNKPIRIIVPFAPGGSTDIFARLVAERLQAPLGEPVIVENRAGASGNIGAEAVAKAPADGYTLLMATTGVMAINNALFKSMGYDAAKDFEPVIFIASITNVLAVPADLPAKNVVELVALAKKDPGKLSFASSGAGSSTHLSAELFKSLAGIDVIHVPFKGSGQALIDVVAGRVSMIFDNMPSALPHIKGGKLRALGVTSQEREPSMPALPTIGETVPGYEATAWFGIGMPKNTPRDIIDKVNAEVNRALADPKFRERMAELGGKPIAGSPEDFGKIIAAETAKWEKVVISSGAKVE